MFKMSNPVKYLCGLDVIFKCVCVCVCVWFRRDFKCVWFRHDFLSEKLPDSCVRMLSYVSACVPNVAEY